MTAGAEMKVDYAHECFVWGLCVDMAGDDNEERRVEAGLYNDACGVCIVGACIQLNLVSVLLLQVRMCKINYKNGFS